MFSQSRKGAKVCSLFVMSMKETSPEIRDDSNW